MITHTLDTLWHGSSIFSEAFCECLDCFKYIHLKADEILSSPSHTPDEFSIKIGELSGDFLSLGKNIFSTLFQSTYSLLGISKERRMLYGKFNYLFRIWVTAADNLLDDEDKVVLPLNMSAPSHVMHQVISIMTADRILKKILDEAIEKNCISRDNAALLSDTSLQILLPSAAEEASEEQGIDYRPEPDYVLYTIHRLKTGILFHIPFLGPDILEHTVDSNDIETSKTALGTIGLGCQLLDDIKDMQKDYIDKRHNYVLSKIYWEENHKYRDLLEKMADRNDVDSSVFLSFPDVVFPTAELAKCLLSEGLLLLKGLGLGVDKNDIDTMVLSLFSILGVKLVYRV